MNKHFQLAAIGIVLFSLFSLHQKQEILLRRSQAIIYHQTADAFELAARRFRLRVRNDQEQQEPRTEKYEEESAPKFELPGSDLDIDLQGRRDQRQEKVTATVTEDQIELILQIAIPFLAALLGGSAGAGGFGGFLTRVIAALKAFQDSAKEDKKKESPAEQDPAPADSKK